MNADEETATGSHQLVILAELPGENNFELGRFDSDRPFPAMAIGDFVDGHSLRPHPSHQHWKVISVTHVLPDPAGTGRRTFGREVRVVPRSSSSALGGDADLAGTE